MPRGVEGLVDGSDLRHAYAVLGLSPPVTEPYLKRHYKALAKRWHPDRFQNDPDGQARATESLRDINIAYEIVAASLSSVGTHRALTPAEDTNRPYALSREQVDAIVDSINRAGRVSLLPQMSVHRWLSVVAVVLYVVVSGVALPSDSLHERREIAKAFSMALGFFSLPLYLIWSGDNDSRSDLEGRLYRVIGWLLMSLPSVVAIVLWIVG